MHLVIYFCGTKDEGESFTDGYNYVGAETIDVGTILVEGCDHQEVCNQIFFPNLSEFSERFVDKLFTVVDGNLFLSKSGFDQLAVGIRLGQPTNVPQKDSPINRITLCGLSRGGITCFYVAKKLNSFLPSVPVDIIANQPTPGNSILLPGSNGLEILDCKGLSNLAEVSVILGAYTGSHKHKNKKIPDWVPPAVVEWGHRTFFSQLVPKLPINCKKNIVCIPLQFHDGPPGSKYLHRKLRSSLLGEDSGIDLEMSHFPRIDKLQKFFGITHRKLYQYQDRRHPAYYLSEGYELGKEPIMNWWNKHDKESSYFFMSMSGLTRSLIESIRLIDAGKQPLIHLFEKVDTWLAVKAHTKSSRYPLVDALRNNIYHQLVTSHSIQATQLDWISRTIHHEEKYFKHHWRSLSSSASFWKTEATKGLDKAFKTHAKNKLSKENDEILLTALNQWIQEKQGSDSKRWDIVLEMKEILEEAIKLHSPNLAGDSLVNLTPLKV